MLPDYITLFLEIVGIYLILLWAIYVPFRGGQLYNGPIYSMAIGGYFAAYMSKAQGWSFASAFFGAAAVGGLCGFLPALAFSRTKGMVTAVASIALIFIIQTVIINLDFLGGSRGISGLPGIKHLLLFDFLTVLVIGAFVYRVDNSRIGKALEAMRTDLDMTYSMGINPIWLSTFVLTVASIFGAVAGALYAFALRAISPVSFGFSLLLNSMTMLFIGGRYTMWGIFISAPVLWGLPLFLPPSITKYSQMAYGALLIVVLIVQPEGFVTRELLKRLRDRVRLWFNKTGESGQGKSENRLAPASENKRLSV